MNIHHTILLILTAVALSSCSPHANPNLGSGQHGGSLVPAPELKKYNKVPTGYPDPQGRANMVVSPYRPYNVIDVSGYHSGDIVGDRSTAIVNPGTRRLDLSTSKYFRIP